MSERNKELVWAIVFFVLAISLGAYAVLGKVAFGAMSLLDTKDFCAVWSLCCVVGAILGLIGDQRLNSWINPRIETCSQKRAEIKERRRTTLAALDLKYPNRVTRREERKKFLCRVAGWILLVSPLVAIIVSIVLIVCLKTEIYYMILAISILYAIQLWGFMLRTYLQMKKDSKNNHAKIP